MVKTLKSMQEEWLISIEINSKYTSNNIENKTFFNKIK